MAAPGGSVDWPLPEKLFEWLGESNLSRDSQSNAILGVTATAVEECYTRWYGFHREIVTKLDVVAMDLRTATAEKKSVTALKARNAVLERETVMMREESTKIREKNEAWAVRYEKLADNCDALRTAAGATPGVSNTVLHKIKPLEPRRYDGSQDLEVVTKYLDEVEHYVRQGVSMCPKASPDNQNIDTFWRFLSVKIFRWFEKEMKERDVETIPPTDNDYKIKWVEMKRVFKEQFVPEVAVSVVRKEWHALKFSKNQVLKFNQRALELVEILGGSLSITRENPLWEEYLRKLPEAAAQDIAQQARLMRRVHKIDLTLSDMMEIMAERTLPYLPPVSLGSPDASRATANTTPGVTTTTTDYGDPMDLSNLEDQELYTVDDGLKRCHRCQGFGHIARQCPTPSSSVRPAQYRQNQQRNGQQQQGGYQRYGNQQHQGGHQQQGGYQQSRREPPTQRQPTQRPPFAAQRQPSQRPDSPPRRQNPTSAQRGFGSAGKIYMVGENQRVYAVDDFDAGVGAYFEGNWADEDDWESSKGPRIVDLGEVSDGEKGEAAKGSEGGAGKAKQ
jgi:hypothetical protein